MKRRWLGTKGGETSLELAAKKVHSGSSKSYTAILEFIDKNWNETKKQKFWLSEMFINSLIIVISDFYCFHDYLQNEFSI